jgi:hypothetical protein
MNRLIFSIRYALFAVVAGILVMPPPHVFAQEDENGDENVVIEKKIEKKPRIKKFQYKYRHEPGKPVDILTADPDELIEGNNKIIREYQLFSDSAYRNAFRVYIDAARPYIDMMRTEDDIDIMRLMDTTGNGKYKEIPELERKSFELARAYHDASKGNAKETVEKELKNTLGKLFELREERKQDEVKRIETDLQKTKAKMADRRTNKETIVKRRLDQLLGKRDDLEW